ncbi:MAG TPA: hypothetical protein VEV42_09435 [Pyrinomonadaceae bacterium]|nr:hypothetical protein [Pyrinomonadaceae bacterium]
MKLASRHNGSFDLQARQVQDAGNYRKLLDLKERADVVEILRHRLASRSTQKGRTVEDFFSDFFAKNKFVLTTDEKVQRNPHHGKVSDTLPVKKHKKHK